MKRSLIVAMSDNRVIGRDGDLPWRLPADMKRFRRTTLGHAVIMGRRTWESLPKGALKRRFNVVVTRRETYDAPGAHVASSLERAWATAAAGEVDGAAVAGLVVIGGAGLYAEALATVDTLHVTHVRASVEGDVRFPEVDWDAWTAVAREEHDADDRHAYPFEFVTYERR